MKLYHYTKKKYLPLIMEHGLIPGRARSLYTPVMVDKNYVWLETKLYKLRKNVETAIVEVNPSLLNKNALELIRHKQHSWYRYKGIIPPEAIEIVDYNIVEKY